MSVLSLKHDLSRWFMPAIYAAMIFIVSSLPGPPAEAAIRVSDKLLHMCLYGLMAVLVAMAMQRPGRPLPWRRALIVVLITVAYGVTDEYHQSFVPGRLAGADDGLADAAGAVLGVAWYVLVSRRWPRISLLLGS